MPNEAIEDVYTMMFADSDKRMAQLLAEVSILKLQNQMLSAQRDFFSHELYVLRQNTGMLDQPYPVSTWTRLGNHLLGHRWYYGSGLAFMVLACCYVFYQIGFPQWF